MTLCLLGSFFFFFFFFYFFFFFFFFFLEIFFFYLVLFSHPLLLPTHTRFVLNGTPGFFLAFFSFSVGIFSNRAKWIFC